MLLDRNNFVKALQSVSAGLTAKEIVPQSDCLVFANGEVMAFNDEVACRAPTGLPPEWKVAIKGKELTELLEKRSDEEMEVLFEDSRLIFKGKHKGRWGTDLAPEVDISLPVGEIDYPTKWKKLPDSFGDALRVTCDCAGRDDKKFNLTCVHLTPTHIEAADNFQACRFDLPVPVKENVMVRASSIRHIASLGMNRFAETEGWVHFKSESGVGHSCRKCPGIYDDEGRMDGVFDVDGATVKLPRALEEACDRAHIFSKTNPLFDLVKVTLKPGRGGKKGTATVEGRGPRSGYKESKPFDYDGPVTEFYANPDVLKKVIKERNECVLSEDKLFIQDGNHKYVSMLITPAEVQAALQTVEA